MINCLKEPIHVLMRVLLCKIQCPLVCFCKPFSHIYPASSLKLKTLVSVTSDDAHEEAIVDDGHRNEAEDDGDGVIVDAKEDAGRTVRDTLVLLRSSLRKVDSNSTEAEKKKKVQWVDVVGIKELAEIREFEPSEEDDIDFVRGKTCVCVIL